MLKFNMVATLSDYMFPLNLSQNMFIELSLRQQESLLPGLVIGLKVLIRSRFD